MRREKSSCIRLLLPAVVSYLAVALIASLIVAVDSLGALALQQCVNLVSVTTPATVLIWVVVL